MPVCCICGKKTLNCFIKDRKAYCKSCLDVARMGSGAIMSKKLFAASDDDIRRAINSGNGANSQKNKMSTGITEPLAEFRGKLGRVELYDDKVVIKRGAFHPSGGRSQKEIYLSSITAIQIKKPGLNSGYIQFVLSGSQEIKKTSMFGNEIFNDENSIVFETKEKYEEALSFKSSVESLKSEAQKPTVVLQSQISAADEILKFKGLLDAGVITQEEFNAKKKQLLGL